MTDENSKQHKQQQQQQQKLRIIQIPSRNLREFLEHNFRLANYCLTVPLEKVDLTNVETPKNYVSKSLSRRLVGNR